jgi:hypothetical protein
VAVVPSSVRVVVFFRVAVAALDGLGLARRRIIECVMVIVVVIKFSSVLLNAPGRLFDEASGESLVESW